MPHAQGDGGRDAGRQPAEAQGNARRGRVPAPDDEGPVRQLRRPEDAGGEHAPLSRQP